MSSRASRPVGRRRGIWDSVRLFDLTSEPVGVDERFTRKAQRGPSLVMTQIPPRRAARASFGMTPFRRASIAGIEQLPGGMETVNRSSMTPVSSFHIPHSSKGLLPSSPSHPLNWVGRRLFDRTRARTRTRLEGRATAPLPIAGWERGVSVSQCSSVSISEEFVLLRLSALRLRSSAATPRCVDRRRIPESRAPNPEFRATSCRCTWRYQEPSPG